MSLGLTYAKAFFEAGAGATDLDTGRKQLEQFWNLIHTQKELQIALLGPVVSGREKTEIVRAIANKAGFVPRATQFLGLLARKGRLGALPQILRALDSVRLESQGGILGEVVSADALDQRDVDTLAKAFEGKLKKKVEFRVATDAALLAGLKVTVNGTTYDGTLKAQLERVRDQFVGHTGNVS